MPTPDRSKTRRQELCSKKGIDTRRPVTEANVSDILKSLLGGDITLKVVVRGAPVLDNSIVDRQRSGRGIKRVAAGNTASLGI
jgi:hypothetical protein